MLPPQTEAGGTPLLGSLPFDPANVAALANLPEDGARPEDKHSKNQQTKTEKENSEEPELPEIFSLIMGKDFSELLRFYFFLYGGETWFVKKKWREILGVDALDPIPFSMKKASHIHERRLILYEYSILFHVSMPGKRFSGSM